MLMKIHQTLQLITLFLFIRRKIPVEPIFGIYRQEKKLDKIKFVLFFLLLKFRILIGKSKQKLCNIIGKKFELVKSNEELDKPQPLSTNSYVSFYFLNNLRKKNLTTANFIFY